MLMAALYLFPICLIAAAAYDVRSLRIPNWISALIALSFLPIGLWSGIELYDIAQHYLSGLFVLVIVFILFALNQFGGGDAKLLAASSVWVGWGALLPFVFYASLAGGAIALFMLLLRRIPLPTTAYENYWIRRLYEQKKNLPYGAAIAAGGLMAFPETEIFAAVI